MSNTGAKESIQGYVHAGGTVRSLGGAQQVGSSLNWLLSARLQLPYVMSRLKAERQIGA